MMDFLQIISGKKSHKSSIPPRELLLIFFQPRWILFLQLPKSICCWQMAPQTCSFTPW